MDELGFWENDLTETHNGNIMNESLMLRGKVYCDGPDIEQEAERIFAEYESKIEILKAENDKLRTLINFINTTTELLK